jgi:hypothetical protein
MKPDDLREGDIISLDGRFWEYRGEGNHSTKELKHCVVREVGAAHFCSLALSREHDYAVQRPS